MAKKKQRDKQLYVHVNEQSVPVTKEVYLVYYHAERRMRYFERDIKTGKTTRDADGNITGYEPAKEDSLNRLMETGADYESVSDNVEDIVASAIMSEKLREAIGKLDDSDQKLIAALFFSNDGDGMTEREYATLLGISKTALHARKERVFAKMRELLKK